MIDKRVSLFLAVLENGSIKKAAESLYISPQALTQQMNLLEKETGYPLLNRGSKGVEASAFGEIFAAAAKEILALEKNMQEQLAKERERQHLTLQLGFHSSLESTELLAVAAEAKKRFPEITQKILPRSFGPDAYLYTLKKEKHDIIECSYQEKLESMGLRALILREEKNYCVLPSNSVLRKKSLLSPEDLDGLSILVHSVDLYRAFQEAMKQRAPRAKIQVVSFFQDEANRQFQEIQQIESGCILVVPEFYIYKLPNLPHVVLDFPPAYKPSLIFKEMPGLAVKRFLSLAKEMYPQARFSREDIL